MVEKLKVPKKGRGAGLLDRKWILEFDDVAQRDLAFALLQMLSESLDDGRDGHVFHKGSNYPFTTPQLQGLTVAVLNRQAGYIAEEALRVHDGVRQAQPGAPGADSSNADRFSWTRDELSRVADRMREIAKSAKT